MMDSRRLYRAGALAPLCILLIGAFSGCATGVAVDTATSMPGWDDPEGAIRALSAAWNVGDLDAVTATFLPSRRVAVRAHLGHEGREVAAFEVASADVLSQCHPRGGEWKTGVLRLRPRISGPGEPALIEEIVWMRLHDDHWFMYSL